MTQVHILNHEPLVIKEKRGYGKNLYGSIRKPPNFLLIKLTISIGETDSSVKAHCGIFIRKIGPRAPPMSDHEGGGIIDAHTQYINFSDGNNPAYTCIKVSQIGRP